MYHLWVDNILFGSVDMNTQKFLIPDGIDYYTGNEALLFQNLKTSVLKIFNKYKYEFVITPVVDSINNLNNLNGDNIANTMSLSDRRELGIRADITPQISRLDYQSYKTNKSNKFSYMGDIYRESKSSFERSNPFQVGAEYFGNITEKVDINLLKMCHEIITLSKTKRIVIELNDSFFINTYINKLSIDDTTRKQLNRLISLKSMDEITQYFKSKKLSNRKLIELHELLELAGPVSIMKKIEEFSKKYKYESKEYIKSLKSISKQIKNLKNTDVIIDLCSLNSMDYETSFNYTFYVNKLRKPIAFGGRYESYVLKDDSMRNATGFSLDLKDIVTVYEK
ncbi:ATP phosphoribosyltransferase regulatory subunit [Gammaproteobacteria bacterium]|nr:ATP phosphoribosyltransferase regulatory subunit [Gammaproteobacteria bacterium]